MKQLENLRRPPVLLVIALLLLGSPPVFAEILRETGEWPQWRGPNRDGRIAGPAWPADLSGLQAGWQVELGPSYSGPILATDRVFVTETVDEAEEVIRAFDRATGRELWKTSWQGAMKVPFYAASAGSWVRATPTWDGERLYVPGMREVLVALDGATGKEVWKIDFPARYGTEMGSFGFICSPLIDGESLYVEAAESVIKLDRRTGEEIWRSEVYGGDSPFQSGGFSSPVLATLAGQRQLVMQGREVLRGIDLESGKVLWAQPVPSFRGMNILTPLVWGDRIFTSTYRNASYLYQVERAADGVWSVKELWNLPPKAYMSSPVLHDGHVYLHLGNGRLTAIDLEAGEVRWTSQPLGEYWSMVLQDDKILALSSEGELHLIAADPAGFDLLATREVADSSTWSYLAISGEQLFVRSLDGLQAFTWKDGAETQAVTGSAAAASSES